MSSITSVVASLANRQRRIQPRAQQPPPGVGVATAGVAKGAAMTGLGLSLGPFGTPVMIAGGIVLAGSAFYRINKAAKRDLPLDEYHIFFCKDARCNTRFARELTDAALAMQQ